MSPPLLRRAPAALALLLALLLLCLPPSRAQNNTTAAATTGAACPLNFTVLSDLITPSSRPPSGSSTACGYIQQGLRLVLSSYLQLTGNFLPPLNSSESCWENYQTLIDSFIPGFDIRSSCGFQTSWISEGCMNITTLSQFDAVVPSSARSGVATSCNQSLENSSPCAVCTVSLSNIASYLNGSSVGNVSDCSVYPTIYAAAVANYPFRKVSSPPAESRDHQRRCRPLRSSIPPSPRRSRSILRRSSRRFLRATSLPSRT